MTGAVVSSSHTTKTCPDADHARIFDWAWAGTAAAAMRNAERSPRAKRAIIDWFSKACARMFTQARDNS